MNGLLMAWPINMEQVEVGVYGYTDTIIQVADFDTYGIDELIKNVNATLYHFDAATPKIAKFVSVVLCGPWSSFRLFRVEF